jgi:hypothetical protein
VKFWTEWFNLSVLNEDGEGAGALPAASAGAGKAPVDPDETVERGISSRPS